MKLGLFRLTKSIIHRTTYLQKCDEDHEFTITLFIYGYLAAISFAAIVATVIDKRAAKCDSRRISERSLLLVSALGGSVAMLIAMRLIRHKTKHAKFMVGIPVIIILQIAAVVFVWWQMKGGVYSGIQ